MSIGNPFYGGGAEFFDGLFSDVRSMPYTVNLDGVDYVVDLAEYRHNGITRFREGVLNSGEPNDQLFDTTGAWWRYKYSWHQGSDQGVADLDDSALPYRWATSRGVNPWEKYELCLLPDTTDVLTVAAAQIYMVSTDAYVYVSDGTGVKRSADLSTWNSVTGLAGTVQGICTDGTNVYIATTSNIYTVASTLAASVTTSATAPGAGYDKIAFVSNRLLAATENEIAEIGTATRDVIYTHFQAAFRWKAIFNVGSRIYMGGYAGNRSELYTTTSDDTGALVLSAEAASFFSGELIQDALSYGGQVIIGTSEGIRFATLSSDATLQYGPLLDDMGSSTCLAAQGRFVWFGWENFPGDGCGIGRLALDEFVATLQPAYASDIFTEAVTDDVVAVARWNDRTLFAVSGDAVYASNVSTFVTEGYLDSGDVTFGTVEDKSLSDLRARFSALAANEAVRFEVTDEDDVAVASKTISSLASTELTLEMASEVAERIRVKAVLRGDGSSTPCLRQWRMRAYPIAPTTMEWLVPLVIHSRVVQNDSEGQIISMDPWTETARIRQLWEDSEIVQYKEGEHSFAVRVDNFQIGAVEWRDGSDWMEVTCTVRLLSA